MTRLVIHIDPTSVPAQPDDAIHVLLYGSSPPHAHVGVVGHQALEMASRLLVQPSAAAMDFFAIAMAVTAADTFVLRSDAADGWSRSFEIVLPLAEPARWNPIKVHIERTLRFLSSDQWTFDFVSGGIRPPPMPEIKRRRNVVDISKVDCVALFSGGLDSAIGALDLLAAGKRPLLVSHAAHKDAARQDVVSAALPAVCERMSVNTYPTWAGADDDSMRTRSFQFLALGILAAQAVATFRNTAGVDLYVCENGLIALNPPLTPRRRGSLSTRTAHPHYLECIRDIVKAVQLPVDIVNPYQFVTKGEMVASHHHRGGFDKFATETVSCGKWKRANQQCGRCVPCLIRRAALHAGGVPDHTQYTHMNLQSVMSDEDFRDDLIAVQAALTRGTAISRWVPQSGPLPPDVQARARFFSVALRGMSELASYLRTQGFPV